MRSACVCVCVTFASVGRLHENSYHTQNCPIQIFENVYGIIIFAQKYLGST